MTFSADDKRSELRPLRRPLQGVLAAAVLAVLGLAGTRASSGEAGETGNPSGPESARMTRPAQDLVSVARPGEEAGDALPFAALPREGVSDRPAPQLGSRSFFVMDAASNEVLLARNADTPRSIASLTKLMSAMVYLDLAPDLSETVTVTREDRRGARPAHTRLQTGWQLSATDLLHAALIASENPAVEALARSTGLTRHEFVGLMNRKAQELGMFHTIFFDATGLDADNTATARDVARMLDAAARYPRIVEISTRTDYEATVINTGRKVHYVNSNRLARSPDWNVVAGKTGYITDAGYCLAVSTRDEQRELLMVFLGAPARGTRFGDAARAVAWVKEGPSADLMAAATTSH